MFMSRGDCHILRCANMTRRCRQIPGRIRAEPDSLPALLAWIGSHGWPVWFKITLIVVVVIVAIGLIGVAGGRVVAGLVEVFR
jgi:hypothetical protein